MKGSTKLKTKCKVWMNIVQAGHRWIELWPVQQGPDNFRSIYSYGTREVALTIDFTRTGLLKNFHSICVCSQLAAALISVFSQQRSPCCQDTIYCAAGRILQSTSVVWMRESVPFLFDHPASSQVCHPPYRVSILHLQQPHFFCCIVCKLKSTGRAKLL